MICGTNPPADLNGLVRFEERPILVSALVPSRSEPSGLNVSVTEDGRQRNSRPRLRYFRDNVV